MQSSTLVTLLLAGTALVGGCAGPDPSYGRYDNDGPRYDGSARYPDSSYRYGGTRSNDGYYGVVDSIDFARGGTADNAVAGTIIGGIVGGVVGHQIGSGTGNTVATVAGAIGGAAVGHEIGQDNSNGDLWRVRIRFDNGSYQTVTQADIGRLRVGDSVRIENGRALQY
jgi:outer membrane lipoprotein SlyB